MARLLGYLIGVTNDMGRHELLAPIEQLPRLVELMSPYEPAEEPRTMGIDGWNEAGSPSKSVSNARTRTWRTGSKCHAEPFGSAQDRLREGSDETTTTQLSHYRSRFLSRESFRGSVTS